MNTTPNDSGASNDEVTPPAQTSGALLPPVRHPPTVTDTGAEPPRGRGAQSWSLGDWPRVVADAVTAALDAADRLGDAIASQLGLRREKP